MASTEDYHSDDGMDGEEGEDDLLLLGVLRDMPRELRIETWYMKFANVKIPFSLLGFFLIL